ncbi:hypothetical protein NDU88_006647 [Pleurodeles waltl]|uniref:Uncharacterized protein n=1 Tax=Pleurodeles waltl TaxID=8319 RepID=A0AAV7SQH0_PLEWA|nr:hypothetical protein NDU88_006647 [Pleurodeles waltl]
MARILAVAYPELDGRLGASQQPQGGEYSAPIYYYLHVVVWNPGGGCGPVGARRPGRTLQGVLSSQRSILWQKVKREMQRNSGELLHSVSEEFHKAETLNSQKRKEDRLVTQSSQKIRNDWTQVILVAPDWAKRVWYPEVLHMSVDPQIRLPLKEE